jgi:DNA-binding MarR family transcriptional regulator
MGEEIRDEAREFGAALRRFIGTWRARHAVHLKNTTQRQYMTLCLLDELGETRMGGLAEGLGVTMGAASNVANGLVKAGYIERIYDPQDRRSVSVRLTDEGQREMIRIRQLMLDDIRNVFERLNAVERGQLVRAFRRFVELSERAAP